MNSMKEKKLTEQQIREIKRARDMRITYRLKLGAISQQALAKKFGVTDQTIRKYERE